MTNKLDNDKYYKSWLEQWEDDPDFLFVRSNIVYIYETADRKFVRYGTVPGVLKSEADQWSFQEISPKFLKLNGIQLYKHKSTTTKKRQHEKTKSKKTRTKSSSSRH